MKTISTHKTPTSARTTARPPVVRFTFTAPAAKSVCIAGTFNAWHPHVSPMIPAGGGQWVKELTLSPGTYEYCLVVDGDWRPDPLVGETIANPFGGLNSVLQVPCRSSRRNLPTHAKHRELRHDHDAAQPDAGTDKNTRT